MKPLLRIRVIPNASRTQVVEWKDDVLKIKLQAPPEDGKANAALIAFLAKSLGCRKSAVTLLSGDKSRHKMIQLDQSDPEELSTWLQGFAR